MSDLAIAVTPQSLVFTVTPQTLTFTASPATLALDITFSGPPGIQGPPGPQGIQGILGPAGGSTIQCLAGENISGHRAIRMDAGKAYYCDALTLGHAGTAIGLSTQAGITGDIINVQILGNLIEPSWNWTPGPVFVGSFGQLTQSITGLLFIQQIGIAVNNTELNINPQIAVLRN